MVKEYDEDGFNDVFGSGKGAKLLREVVINTKALLPLADEETDNQGVPQNAQKATGTITFSDTVSDGETVTIGSDIYEFDTGDGLNDGDNISVDVSGGQTASDASSALATAINNNATEDVSATDQTGSVDVICDTPGAQGNDISTSTDASNGSWGDTSLTGGQDGTVTEGVELRVDPTNEELYVAVDENTATGTTGQNWYKLSLTQMPTS